MKTLNNIKQKNRIENYINNVIFEFKKYANSKRAIEQKAYMRNQFDFFGIQVPLRRKIQKSFLEKEYLPNKNDLEKIVKFFWNEKERELQHFSLELIYKYSNQFRKNDIKLFEFMITHKSWWDTIDFIAPKLVGKHFEIYPNSRDKYIEKWIVSENIWLQRSSLLFQLNYKNKLDKEFLSYIIKSLNNTNEFFINKAIGWILRQYSKANPHWVADFVNKTELSNLSRKEALKIINKKLGTNKFF